MAATKEVALTLTVRAACALALLVSPLAFAQSVEQFFIEQILTRAYALSVNQLHAAPARGDDPAPWIAIEARLDGLRTALFNQDCNPIRLVLTHQETGDTIEFTGAATAQPGCEPVRITGSLFNNRLDNWEVELRDPADSNNILYMISTDKDCDYDPPPPYRFCVERTTWSEAGVDFYSL